MLPSPLLMVPGIDLLSRIHDVMGTSPGEEERWLGSMTVVRNRALEERLRSAFRPEHPKSWNSNPNSWLGTHDIEQVMRQYEQSHGESHKFKFVGCFPRDFSTRTWSGQCVSPPMCRLGVASLREEGKAEFGIVFNLDRHDQRGSHWTACYGCINPKKRTRYGIWYYDSVGRAPPQEIKAFMAAFANDVRANAKRSSVPFPVVYNNVRRQFEGSECGIYALFFLAVCLTTRIHFDEICKKVMKNDRTMSKLRKVMFRAPVAPLEPAATSR